ncbi:ShlB/FhaC/HecB family hemolysin secretion/activation protein [Aerosakkonemataceae cyanobacterium BLCC-F154]|uniref:ShlB/FhaC/HecB family hemolysin secretion/activation protein n=1 Tax=Floridaenema fluviatile BLCC-F154 TaxID=3153640 RepID=A0ABV4YA89_9CYAN
MDKTKLPIDRSTVRCLSLNCMKLPKLVVIPVSAALLNLVGFASSDTALFAQQINPSQPVPRLPLPPVTPPPPLPTPEPLPPPSELLTPPSGTPSTPEALPLPSDIPGEIKVEGYEVEGSTVFSKEDFDKVLQPFVGNISFAQLLQARSAITQLYVDNGYITSGAFIPPQTLTGGIVKIQVVEGSIEEIKVTGTGRLNPNYVRSRLRLGAKTPLNVNRLLQSLQLLQLNPLIRNISAELSAGTRPGLSVLEVTVRPERTFNATISLDNSSPPSVGVFRRQLSINQANLTGNGDTFAVNYSNTNGSNQVEANYILPVNARNGTIRLGFDWIKSSIIEEPFDQVDIGAVSYDYELSFRQPIILTPNQELALGLTFNRRESNTTLLGEPFQLSPGANEQGETRLSVIRFFQEWTQRESRSVFAARSQFSLGVGLFDASNRESGPDGHFFSWRGQAQWLRLLGGNAADPSGSPILLIRADMQLADRPLVPLEQFALGGFDSVRGYRQDLFLTDNGILGSVEVRIPVYRLRDRPGVFQVIPFIDVGSVWNNGDRENPDPSTIASIGVGLQWQMGERLRFRFDYGLPLVNTGLRERTLQEQGFYFSFQYNPFARD